MQSPGTSRFSRKPRTASLALVLDGELLGELDQLNQTLRVAKAAERANPSGLNGQVPRLEASIAELSALAAEQAVVFRVKALPAELFDAIRREHPPSAEQVEQYRETVKISPWATMPEFDPASMGADLLVACLVEPDMSETEIREFWAELSKGEQNQLWNLALGVQVEGANLPLSRAAIGQTGDGGEPSTMSVNEEFRSATFSDG